MTTSLMRAPTRCHRIQIVVTLAGGDNVNLDVNAVEVDESGALILRDGSYAVQTVFSPAAWLEVNRR